MAKIVLDARIISSSTGHYCLRLIQYLEKIDHDNEYIVLVPTKDLNFYTPKAKKFRVMAADYKNFSLSEQTKFRTFLNSLHADLVHFMMPQQPVLYRGKKVTTVHDLIPFRTWNTDKNWLKYHAKQFVGRFVVARLWKRNEFIIAPSNYTKKDYESFANMPPSHHDKIRTIYESADPDDTKGKKYNNPFKQYLLYVGHQADYKNLIRLVKAHQKLLPNHPDLGLILVGKINQAPRGVYQFVKSSNAKNVHFTDFISDAERNWLYPRCAAYVFPSLMEGFGLPPLEAMINGAPVVASNATCIPEICGDAAEYFDPLSVDDMTNAITRVIDDPSYRKKLVKRGHKQVDKYSWERCARETLDLYKKALSRPS